MSSLHCLLSNKYGASANIYFFFADYFLEQLINSLVYKICK